MNENLLTVKQAAEKLNVNRQRVLQLINAGRLAAEKLGSYYVIKESDLDAVRERKTGRPPKPKVTAESAESKKLERMHSPLRPEGIERISMVGKKLERLHPPAKLPLIRIATGKPHPMPEIKAKKD